MDKFANKIKIFNTICKHNYIEQEEVGLFCLKPKNRFLKNTWTIYARAELQINFDPDKKKVNANDKMSLVTPYFEFSSSAILHYFPHLKIYL